VETEQREAAADAVPGDQAREVVPREPPTRVAPREPAAEAVPSEVLALAPLSTTREQLELGLFAGGLGLLSAAAGVALYAHVQPSHGAGNATPTASTFAIALAATGLGSIAASGVVVALTPNAATLQTRF
jgi:predicted phage tail protein